MSASGRSLRFQTWLFQDRKALIAPAASTVLILALLIVGSMYVRSLIQSAFIRGAYVGLTRDLTQQVLKYQLDEETGIRGYAATGSAVFLQPFNEARVPFAQALTNLRAHVKGPVLRVLSPGVEDIAATNADWLRTVAIPLRSRPPNALAVELRGKGLVDRMRMRVNRIDAFLQNRETSIAADVQTSIDRLELFIGLAVLGVLLVGFLLGRQQMWLAARAAAERQRAERRERESEALATAYRAEKRIADTLQEAFVQRSLPTQPTFSFSATYVPAAEEAKVGGDWYDALELPDDRVFFAIGDVTGHGLDAAVTMSHVRQSIIMAAMFDPDPASILTRVSQELHKENRPMVTAIVGYADAGSHEFIYASAGHPPPLLIEPDGTPNFLALGHVPLGALDDAVYTTTRVKTTPGAVLVLYTDGAVEHTRDVLEGEALLIDAAAVAVRETSSDYATVIHRAIFADRSAGDDVAILTIGFSRRVDNQIAISVESAKTTLAGTIGPA